MKQGLLFPANPGRKPDKTTVVPGVTIDDMPNNDMRLVAEAMGVPFALDLLRGLAGIQLSVPKFGLKKVWSRIIRKRFDGTNIKALALEYGLTESMVRQIVNGPTQKEKNDD